MSSTFLSSYLHEVTSSLSNWHTDNYDFYRSGPQPQRSWKTHIADYLRRRGCLPNDAYSDGVMAAVQLVEASLAHFEWLYNQLADDESREILIKVMAFRALGHRRVKLPLNTPTYWDELKLMERLANPSDFIPLSFLNWQLHRMDLNAVGVPVQLYSTPMGAHHQFVLEQYRCRSHDGDIAVEPGDYVIDAGACWGDTALYFAYRSKPDGRVFSYEFIPDNLEIMRRNLALNPDLSNRIQVIERAAWDKSNLTISVQGEGPGSSVCVGETGVPDAGPLTLAIDDLVEQQNLPIVDFIKMDIEGAELPALRGAMQTIQRHKPKLAISVYHRLTDFFEIPEYLDSLGVGYRYFLRHYSIHAEETVLFAKANQRCRGKVIPIQAATNP
jgi:FkbM family methyltransferase